jgi:hypothetical protein
LALTSPPRIRRYGANLGRRHRRVRCAGVLEPREFLGRTIEIAGDALTLRYSPIRIETQRQQSAELARAIEYLNATGCPVDLTALRELHQT